MIIGLGYKTQVGKDLTADIIQYLTFCKIENKQIPYSTYKTYINPRIYWENKKFATKLKQIVCILTDCTIEQLENNDFKNSKLSKDWNRETLTCGCDKVELGFPINNKCSNCGENIVNDSMTYRELLQQLGTNLLRNQLHQNIWVNALMNEYKIQNINDKKFATKHSEDESSVSIASLSQLESNSFPNWIISDVRFPNEADIIKNKGGILIKINRNTEIINNHESEIILDNYTKWDYIIDNDDKIEYLIKKVREILIKEKII